MITLQYFKSKTNKSKYELSTNCMRNNSSICPVMEVLNHLMLQGIVCKLDLSKVSENTMFVTEFSANNRQRAQALTIF